MVFVAVTHTSPPITDARYWPSSQLHASSFCCKPLSLCTVTCHYTSPVCSVAVLTVDMLQMQPGILNCPLLCRAVAADNSVVGWLVE